MVENFNSKWQMVMSQAFMYAGTPSVLASLRSYYVPLDNVVNPDDQDIKTMIDDGSYFSIFAPQQSGKTTFMEELRTRLHRDSTYLAVLLSFQ